MAVYSLTNFFEAQRALLGDEGDDVAGYDFQSAQLAASLRTVVRMGHIPGVTLSGLNDLSAEPPNPDTWGYLVARAAHILIGGAAPVNIRTRALSISSDPSGRRDSLSFIETMISDIDARGNVGGGAGDTGSKGLFGTLADVATYCALPQADLWVPPAV